MNFGELKKKTGRISFHTHAPKRVWDYFLEHESRITSFTSSDRFAHQGLTSEELTLRYTLLTSLLAVNILGMVYFHEPTSYFPESKEVLGSYLGATEEKLGTSLCKYVLTTNCTVAPSSTV